MPTTHHPAAVLRVPVIPVMRVCVRALMASGAMVFLSIACAGATAAPSKDLSALIDLCAVRLEISRSVALTKWDTQQPVADPPGDPRERQVIDAASEEASRVGLRSETASAFFADQVEASKLVQIVLMADWRRSGGAPLEPRADLKTALRPALDKLRSALIQELIATRALRVAPECPQTLAMATLAHVNAHRLPAVYRIALDRGMARVCGE
ncbi:chorismate mutase [Variovorax sp. OK605]|uniref:chorismate mutase n=1 Tax=Variovorax sp. OK605 TaxID=1855317 RepID=UPI000A7F8B23|nr:chorismate mutase [Variovorax sp. OK605]